MKTLYTILFSLLSIGLSAQCGGMATGFPAPGFTPGLPPVDDSKQFAIRLTDLVEFPDAGNGDLDYFAAVTSEGNVVGCGPVSSNGSVAVGNMQISFECGNTVPLALNCSAEPACNNCEVFQVYYYDSSADLFYPIAPPGNPNGTRDFPFVDVLPDNGDGTFGDGVLDGFSPVEAVNGNNGGMVDVTRGTNDFNSFFAPLPVGFASFTAQVQGKTVGLQWQTSSETGNESFTIERSASGENFNAIGRVAGSGDTDGATDYIFTDSSPSNGNNYYRLRQNDFDGSHSFSSVVLIDFDGADAGAMSISPNPASEQISVRLSGTWSAESVNGSLVEASGRVVKDWQQRPGTSLSVDLAGVPAGIYQLMMTDGKTRQTQRVIVR